ncbi:hypothetical protein LX36DRAFT_664904 [Colletotrichum falcatum]|nr:hypothetical protein LX36DRAFT_664904 [Colletotrichum falcatum]
MLEGKSKCYECTRRGRSCDASASAICDRESLRAVVFSSANAHVVDRLLTEADRLEREEEAEEILLRKRAEALRRAQAEMDESLSKLDRLRKAKRMVFKKGRAIPDPPEGLASSDESLLVREAQSSGAFGVIDWDAVMAGSSGFDFDFGTPQEVAESSGGS